MGMLGDGKKKNKPDPPPEYVVDEDEMADVHDRAEAIGELRDGGGGQLHFLEAFACAIDGMSPSELREFLRRNPECNIHTAIGILL